MYYAYLAWGLLELYEATFVVEHLQEAFRLTERLLAVYRDPAGGFFQSAGSDGPDGVRLQPTGDGALPSANSVALLVLLKLGRIGDQARHRQAAEELLRRHSESVRRHPQGFTFLLSALDFYHGPSSEVVVAGDSRSADTASLARTFRRSFQPRAVLLLRPAELVDPPVQRLAPFTGPYGAGPDGRALAYVCRNFACRLPVADPEVMLALLKER